MRRKKFRWVKIGDHYKIVQYRETEDEQIDRLLRTSSFWKRHPEPFNKRASGRMRRQERKFVQETRAAWLDHGDIQDVYSQ